MALKVCKRKVKPSKSLAIYMPKQFGFPKFNAGREHLPVRSGADKLMAISVRKRKVGRVNDLLLNRRKQVVFRISILEENIFQ
jgi:hypothetical protein